MGKYTQNISGLDLEHDLQQLWKCINGALHRKAIVSLPAHNSTNSFSSSFLRYFMDKITNIRASFPGYASSCNIDFPVVHHPCTVFKPASLSQVAKILFIIP